ncbi:MAG: hypothetical protein AAFV62_07480, partial [Pseudomonadota bacterium]
MGLGYSRKLDEPKGSGLLEAGSAVKYRITVAFLLLVFGGWSLFWFWQADVAKRAPSTEDQQEKRHSDPILHGAP